MGEGRRSWLAFLPRLGSHWLSLLGAVLVSMAGATLLTALAIDFTSAGLNPYAASIVFLVMPGVMAVGLFLIPVGLYLARRRRRREKEGAPSPDGLGTLVNRALENETVRRRVVFVLVMTVLNVLIFSTVTYRAVTFMETPRFCGNVCHTVMQPEFDAYNSSAHSRVACVECHVGSGASSTLKAKLAGLRQVWGVLTSHYPRPIPTPVHSLRPANETCEHCHQPGLPGGSQVGFRVHFKKDQENTPQVTALLFHTGGKDRRSGRWSGIHWHTSDRFQVKYEVLDDKRDTVGKVQVFEDGKLTKEFLPEKTPGNPVREVRTMDCVDCHNRATHTYDGPVEEAVERALADGRLDRKVPWLHEMALASLKDENPSRDGAEAFFLQRLGSNYDRLHPQEKPAADVLAAASQGLAALYRRNVYPAMRVGWDTYPTQMGHGGPDPGNVKTQCFRCHGGDHKTTAGDEIPSKCELCHEVVVKGELPADLPDEIKPLLQL